MNEMKVENLPKDCPQRVAYTKITIGDIEVYVSTVDLDKAKEATDDFDTALFLWFVDSHILHAEEKYETAIYVPKAVVDDEHTDTVIVEGYYHLPDALKGHQKWVESILKGQTRFEDFRTEDVLEIPHKET